MKRGAHHSPAACAKIAGAVRAAMADPAIRQRISERTKAGMRATAESAPELQRLREACREFLSDLLTPLWMAAAVSAE